MGVGSARDGCRSSGIRQKPWDTIGVPVFESVFRFFFKYDRFKPFHYRGSLRRMASRANSEMNVRLRKLQVYEESVRHHGIIVLTSMKHE